MILSPVIFLSHNHAHIIPHMKLPLSFFLSFSLSLSLSLSLWSLSLSLWTVESAAAFLSFFFPSSLIIHHSSLTHLEDREMRSICTSFGNIDAV